MVEEKAQTIQNTETTGTQSSVSETVAALKGIPTKEALLEMLKTNVVEVTFQKLNGDERVMPCTLQELYLPPAKKDEPLTQKKVREVSDAVVAVWAMEANAFRSFRYDRVKAVRVLDWHIGENNS